MDTPSATRRFDALDRKMSIGDYNYNHFRTRHYLLDVQGTATARGIRPDDAAPDFEVSRADGGSLRLSDLRSRPALLHFGSLT